MTIYDAVYEHGKGNIQARIILDSIYSTKPGICEDIMSMFHGEVLNEPSIKRITTFELQYPRFIHSELMTHRVFSRNAASSRAIPYEKMLEQCNALPIDYGKNKSGMQSSTDASIDASTVQDIILSMREHVFEGTNKLSQLGCHKQLFNRYLEPFQMMKTIVTATEFENFFWLRDHEAADPTIHELARCMKECFKRSIPQTLTKGQWHLPYIYTYHTPDNTVSYHINETGRVLTLTLEEAKIVSMARCAAVSYRNTDYTLSKSKTVFLRLIGDDRKHWSAMEHQATPIISDWQEGVTHKDRNNDQWSGNFKGWIQLRQLLM